MRRRSDARRLAAIAASVLCACLLTGACGRLDPKVPRMLASAPTEESPPQPAPAKPSILADKQVPAGGESGKITVRFVEPAAAVGVHTVELTGPNAEALCAVGYMPPNDPARSRWFAVFVADAASAEARPMLGSYHVDKTLVRFTPRFALVPGVRYKAVVTPAEFPVAELKHVGDEPLTVEFSLPERAPSPAARVVQVFPTSDKLPENLLKFYLHFSAPMQRGGVYDHLRLLDEHDKVVELPFLELGEELWHPEGTRLTLLLDPGRVKQGLKPREEDGPVLEAGKHYTLVISADLRDAHGEKLAAEFRKPFDVLPVDDVSPDPENWTIAPPSAGSRDPLVVEFPEPLDEALLSRLLWVVDSAGERVTGEAKILAEETRWEFTPEQAWPAGGYQLVAETTLEDRCGNSIGRPFEVDLQHPITNQVELETRSREFAIE